MSKSKNDVKVTKLPPGPIDPDCMFQVYANDERLGVPPLTRKPLEFAKFIGPTKTIFDALREELEDAYLALEEISEPNDNKKED